MSIKKEKSGFTLIELLVVIAIIGILAGIVLVSLGSARNSAYDAEIKSELQQIRADSELYYLDNGSYSGYSISSNFTPPKCAQNTYSISTSTDNQKIAFFSKLCSNTSEYWCVDSSGAAAASSTSPSEGKCP